MKAIAVPLLAMVLATGTQPLYAQKNQPKEKEQKNVKEETIVIQKNGSGGNVVEIRDGELFINGEKIETGSLAEGNKKIIIENDGNVREERNIFPRKAMLGVYSSKDDKGVAIERIMEGSAADKAGLKEDDVITSIDGKKISSPQELSETIAQHDANDKIAIAYERDGKQMSATVELEAAPRFSRNDFPRVNDMPNFMREPLYEVEDFFAAGKPRLGVSVEDRLDGNGVTVKSIREGSVAMKAGLKENDVILKLGDKNITSVDELQYAVRESETNRKIPLQYQRGGKALTADVTFLKDLKKKDL